MVNSRMNNWFLSLRFFLLSCAMVALGVSLKVSFPVVLSGLVTGVPQCWSVLVSWLTPPYLYIVINIIIIIIAVSSRFHSNGGDVNDKYNQRKSQVYVPIQVPVGVHQEFGSGSGMKIPVSPVQFNKMVHSVPVSPVQFDNRVHSVPVRPVQYDNRVHSVLIQPAHVGNMVHPGYVPVVMNRPVLVPVQMPVQVNRIEPVMGYAVEMNRDVVGVDRNVGLQNGDDEFVISKSDWTPSSRRILREITTVKESKPLVSSRFGHKKNVKFTPEASKPLGVSKPKRQGHDTLESTWKTITDGRSIPLTRHLKKSETWETQGNHNNNVHVDEGKMKKSETFNNPPLAASSPVKLKKEASLSHDELNRRVEAFINKFNEEMRLQRQESLNQYKEMVRRGA